MAAGIIFFFFFLFGNKKFLGLGEILCATAVPRGSPAPTPPSPSFASYGGERGRGNFWAGVNVVMVGEEPSPIPHKLGRKDQEGPGREKCQQGDTNPLLQSGLGGAAAGPSSQVQLARLCRPHSWQPVKASARWLFWRQCF